jgi:Holliday junction resolvase
MRRYPNLDSNQPDIVKALREAGASVTSLASVGGGCPDLLVGIRKVTTVMEVKDGAKPPSKRKLTEAEQDWHDAYRGSVHIVESVEQALAVLAAL